MRPAPRPGMNGKLGAAPHRNGKTTVPAAPAPAPRACPIPNRDALKLAVAVPVGRGLGFRLAGVPVIEVERGGEAAAMRELCKTPGLGVVLVEEDVLGAAAGEGSRRDCGTGLPVVVPFSLPHRLTEEGRGRAFIAALVRRAVGYHVKLGGRS